MKIEILLTKRLYNKWHSWQLVYEWEDVFKEKLGAKFRINPDNGFRFLKYFSKLYNILPLGTKKPSFVFLMLPEQRYSIHNNKPNVVPCIIDWYLKSDDELNCFFKKFNKHKTIVVTSKEVYEYLSKINTPIKFSWLPLSISDKYRISENESFDKNIDIVLIGRQNNVLLGWLEQYRIKHPELCVVRKSKEKYDYKYYTQDGVFVANAETREDCINLLKRSKVGLFSTKGMDGDYSDFNTNGFSQVTPRFLEYIATGNHIIARYPENADTNFYDMKSICPHTETYEEFEKQMDFALNNPVDMVKYSKYLESHYTSTRVPMLENIVKDL